MAPQELFKKNKAGKQKKKVKTQQPKRYKKLISPVQKQHKKLISKGFHRVEMSLASKAGIVGRSSIFKAPVQSKK